MTQPTPKKTKLIGNGPLLLIALVVLAVLIFGISKILKTTFVFLLIIAAIVILGLWLMRRMKPSK